jgi:hypothetical protein
VTPPPQKKLAINSPTGVGFHDDDDDDDDDNNNNNELK